MGQENSKRKEEEYEREIGKKRGIGKIRQYIRKRIE